MSQNAEYSPMISVLVPIYGVEPYIATCARSLFEQQAVDAEYIFVDDASKDCSVQRLEKVIAEYPTLRARIRILHHERNRGLAAARRTAIEAARGVWVVHVDSDDRLCDKRALLYLLEEAVHTSADLVYGGYCEQNDRKIRQVVNPNTHREQVLRSLLRQDYRVSNRIWGVLIRRSLHQQFGLWPVEGLNFAEDYALMPRLVYSATAIATVETPLYAYRTMSAGSYMNSLTQHSADSYVQANMLLSDYFRTRPDYVRWYPDLMLGKLNIAKWILKRGLPLSEYWPQLFQSGEQPVGFMQQLYYRVLRTQWLPLVRFVAYAVNTVK
jgi:glycosyltransferase involved in cell wall biosynthesis